MRVVARCTLALRSFVALAGLLGIAGCVGGDSGDAAHNAESMAEGHTTNTMSGMGSMAGMQGSMDTSRVMEQMEAHMRAMDGAGVDSVQAMRPVHQRIVTSMLAQFNRDMADMKMSGDSAWTASVDSLQRDLTRMSAMSASELHQFAPTHYARVTRLMGMHRTMMGNRTM